MVKNMLEDKKLKLNQPILSVRKYSATKFEYGVPIMRSRRPLYRPEPKSLPIKTAGAVPFQWENTPGQPKQDSHHQLLNVRINNINIRTEDHKISPDEAVADALDTLSTIESFLRNSRMVGPYLTEKQSPVQRQRRPKMKLVYQNNLGIQYPHTTAKQNKGKQESDKDCDHHGYLLPNCGLRPRFCIGSSVCLVDSVPPKNEYEVKSIDKSQKAETKENKKSWEKNEKAVLGISEETKRAGSSRKTFQELLADESSPKEFNSGDSVVNDTSHELNYMSHFSPTTHDHRILCSRDQYNEANTRQRIDQLLVEDFKKLSTADGEVNSVPNVHKSGDFCIVSSSTPKTYERRGMRLQKKAFTQNQYSTEPENTQESEKETAKNVEKQIPRSITLGRKYGEFVAPPPLPKSPSDSWLGRTLPSISTNNESPRLYRGAPTKSSKLWHL